MKRGVTLVEVLIAIFVIMFGILGLFAVLTLGRSYTEKTETITATLSCGDAVLSRVKMPTADNREYVRPSAPITETGWTSIDVGRFFYNGGTYPTTTQPNDTSGLTGLVLIDPLGYAKSAGVDFPAANPTEPRALLSDTTNPIQLAIPRITHWSGTAAAPVAISGALADRQNTWSDDVIIPLVEGDSRPRQVYLAHERDSGGKVIGRRGVAMPWQPGDSQTTPAQLDALHGQSEGVYTWSVMVKPDDAQLALSARAQTQFTAWVLIYQRREVGSTVVPVERTVVCNMVGNGVIGGDVKLTTTNGPEYFAVKRDQWLLLVGLDSSRRIQCAWYQIEVIDRDVTQETATRWSVNATLRGSDWPVYDPANPSAHWLDRQRDPMDSSLFINAPFDLDNDGNACDVLAVIVDGLVRVHPSSGRTITIPSY
jgi:type II secretory pathway pseudopilin PulG